MAPLISLNQVSIGFRGLTLFDNVTCQIDAKHPIGLMGRNGSGKATDVTPIFQCMDYRSEKRLLEAFDTNLV